MQCSQCQHGNPQGLKFCNECGTPLSGRCAQCGFTNESGSKFCGECGTALTAQASVPSPVQPTQRGEWAEMRFQALLPRVVRLLRGELSARRNHSGRGGGSSGAGRDLGVVQRTSIVNRAAVGVEGVQRFAVERRSIFWIGRASICPAMVFSTSRTF